MAHPRRIASASAAEHAARGERAVEGVASVAAKGTHAWLGSQAELLREVEAAGRGMLQRRREAIEAAQRSLEEIQSSHDVIEAMKIQQHWASETLQRFAAEMGELSVLSLTVSQRTMGSFMRTGRSMAEEARNAEDFALSAAGAKPSQRSAAGAKPSQRSAAGAKPNQRSAADAKLGRRRKRA